MKIGKLKDQIIILRPTTTIDSERNTIRGWEQAATIWAEVGKAQGVIVLTDGGFSQEGIERKVKCWPHPDLQEAHRAVYAGSVYNIVNIDREPREYTVTLKGTAEKYEG